MDTLAKKTLRRAICTGQFIKSTFSQEYVQLRIRGNKVLRSPTKAIQEAFSRRTAQVFYDQKGIISSEDYELVYWNGLARVMASWPMTVRAAYSKTLVKFIGVNHFLNQISLGQVDAKCPCCSHPDETTKHIILCQNSARTKLYYDSVNKLAQWINKQQTDPLISAMVLKYLRTRKTLTMRQCYSGSQSRTLLGWVLAKAHDRLGWRNFSEGRIASKYKSIQCQWYAANFIAQLIKIINLQWTYRNNFMHYRLHSGDK